MNRNIVLELFLIASVASIWISGAVALQQYQDAYNTTFSTNATCRICHVNPAGGGPLTSYGMQFQNQTNHAANPGAALQTIGQAPVVTPMMTATPIATVTVISTLAATPTATATATLISTPPPLATPAPTVTQMPVETTVITTPVPTPTPSTPGFGLGVFIAGLLACYFILKRRN